MSATNAGPERSERPRPDEPQPRPPRRTRGRSLGPVLVLRAALVALVVLAGGWAIVRTATVSAWRDRVNPAPDLERPPASRLTGPAVRRLQSQGIVVRPAVRRMLDVLLAQWAARPDLQRSMAEADGTPNIGALLSWAQSIPDSSSARLVPHLGAVEELRSRLGFFPANGKVLPVIYWGLQNRAHPSQDLTKTIGRLAELWDARPDVRARFTVDGRLDVLGLLRFVNRLPKTDPAYAQFIDDTIPIHEAIGELERTRRG